MEKSLGTGVKRKHKRDRFKLAKHAKLNAESEKKYVFGLTDLDDTALEHILQFLDLNELTNVANVCKQFNSSVHGHLRNKCIGRMVTIDSCGNAHWLSLNDINGKFVFKDHLEVESFFDGSPAISQLSINYVPYVGPKQRFLSTTTKTTEKSVLENCSETLNNIRFSTRFYPAMSDLTKPLSNVVDLELDQCELSANLCKHLNSLFPSLRRLVLNECKTPDPKCIEVHFPSLQELIVHGIRWNRMVFKKQNIIGAIRLNPQISRLVISFNSTNDRHAASDHIDYSLDSDFYRFVSESLPKLKYLKMFGQRERESKPCGHEIAFGRVRKFSLHYIYTGQPANIAPFSFERLRELELEHMKILSDDWIDFIVKNKRLKKLTIDFDRDFGTANIERVKFHRMLKKLPELEKIHLRWDAVDIKDVSAVLSMCKSLVKVYLRGDYVLDSMVQEIDRLTAKKSWAVFHDSKNIILTRYVRKKKR